MAACAILVLVELRGDQGNTVLSRNGRRRSVNRGAVVAVAVIGRDERLAALASERSGRLVDAGVFAGGVAAEVLAEELHLGEAEAVLDSHGGAWLVSARRDIFAPLVHRVVLHEEVVFPVSHKLDQSGVDAFEGLFAQGFLAGEDARAFVVEVEHFKDGLPRFVAIVEEFAPIRIGSIHIGRTVFIGQ